MTNKNKWFQILKSPKRRQWEELYRNRWQYDRVVRSTHGVNCTGSCSWNVYVKDGVVTGEIQADDYPEIGGDIPHTEPRGCPRGASFSWYLYNPMRIKYPYIRGTLLDLWREAKSKHDDPVKAWESIVEDKSNREKYTSRRGKGGLRRADFEEVSEIIAASNLYTIKKYGPDRIIGFTPIPAMSQVSYAAGSRYLNLIGGVVMSFYDWYCDLPLASPQVWGEQTDVCESADWYNSKYTVLMGSNVNVTRTPDAHYLYESKLNGTKVVVMSPDYSSVTKGADLWLKLNKGEDGAFWLAVDHVILSEFYRDKNDDYFNDYVKKYTDLPYLVVLDDDEEYKSAGKYLRASDIENTKNEEHADWKPAVFDEKSKSVSFPLGSVGYRWAEKDTDKQKWRIENKCGVSGEEISPALSLIDIADETVAVNIPLFDRENGAKNAVRHVPAVEIETVNGKKFVTTIFDLLNAQVGVNRGLKGDYPASYEDENAYTPAWQEKLTGVKAETVIQVAREFADNASKTKGKSMIIIGAGVNHWYHSDLMYRSAIMALMLTGSVGVNGGGLAHYVGQEKVAMLSSWATLAMAGDWLKPPRVQNTPSFWYMHSNQWKYEGSVFDYFQVKDKSKFKEQHNADFTAKAVRLGWLPFYPNFSENPLKLAEKEDPAAYITEQLKNNKLRFAVEETDREENHPRVWFIWRANAIASSAKGHEYFMRHVLGTDDNLSADEKAGNLQTVENIKNSQGKLDLVVDLNFRMDTSALYSDIILPAATWYEKDDLNTTDMHSFAHPLRKAVAPLWESKSDWDTFKAIAKKFSTLAKTHFDKPVKDIVAAPLMHDTPGEIAQSDTADWKYGETDPVPGKTMPKLVIVERDYQRIYDKFISWGPVASKSIGAHGVAWDSSEEYDELKKINGAVSFGGSEYPKLEEASEAVNTILHMAPEGNGKAAEKGFKKLGEICGIDFSPLVKGNEKVKMNIDDITIQPRRINTSPYWSGIVDEGRPYSSYTINTEFGVPWRTITGRQHFYLDHEFYIAAGEALPVYKPNLAENSLNETDHVPEGALKLNYHTPHGKWQIHSTYFDNLRMLSLSRGGQVIWLNEKDADSKGIEDNDWVEVYNNNGVVVCKTVVSSRMPEGVCYIYHATERTINAPLSEKTGNRSGNHNSLTRVRLKPLAMAGGYGQFSYYFNYWGPIGVNRDSYVIVKKAEKVRF